jgi:glyoxylase I family protein
MEKRNMNNRLTEEQVINVVLNWYQGTNDHIPIAELEHMLNEGVQMKYPNTPEPIVGVESFRKWYADVLQKYFDETHAVESLSIDLSGSTAKANVVVRWENRSWPLGAALSQYSAYLSKQRFVVARCPDSGRVVIKEKHVLTFEQTMPIYGPWKQPPIAGIHNSMLALVCGNPLATELFYTKHFGFKRARVYLPGENQVVVLRNGNTYIQIFPAFAMRPQCLDFESAPSPYPGGKGAGPLYPGVRKLAFLVDNVERKLAEMGDAAKITQSSRPGLVPGSKTVWLADPSGNVVELIEGYYDENDPPQAPATVGLEFPIWNKTADVDYAVNLARKGDVVKLGQWLNAGGNPNQYDKAGWTPLLASAVRGQSGAVEALLNGPWYKSDPDMPHRPSGGLPIHFAGHSGDIKTAELILRARPDHLDKVWELNGHTLFLQAVFYGHLELTRFALCKGADTSMTTVRGLGGMELAQQFQNRELIAILAPYDKPASDKRAYWESLLKRIAPIVPASQVQAQRLSDELVKSIMDGLANASLDAASVDLTLQKIREFVVSHKMDINRLGGDLQQPPIVVTVTGNDGDPANPSVARLRMELAHLFLDCGADPTLNEIHPMGVNAFIRASVFNHLDILKLMGTKMTPQRLTDTLNQQPSVNGLTALHDTVLRASTASPERLDGYLDQIRWFIASGVRTDIEDYSGRTQRGIAEQIGDPQRRATVLNAMSIASQ